MQLILLEESNSMFQVFYTYLLFYVSCRDKSTSFYTPLLRIAVSCMRPSFVTMLVSYPPCHSTPSLLLPTQIKPPRRIHILPQTLHHLLRTQRLHQYPRIPRTYEPTPHRILDPLNQARPIPIYIIHHNRHTMYTQLIPRRDLHELLERAVPTAQRDEASARPAGDYFPGHHLLAGVHVCHDGGAAVDGGVDRVA